MNHRILLMGLLAATITSCSTYKAGQTPDDVYYSPAREVSITKETKQETRREEYVQNEEDRFLRMKVQNRYRWSTLDDYDYWYDSRYDHCACNCYPKTYGWNANYYGYYNPWRPTWYYGSYYSPAYPIVFYKNPKVYSGTTGKSNLISYRNQNYNNTNYNYNPKNPGANQNTNFGNLMKQVFTSPGGNSVERPARTFDSNTRTSSNAGGRSSGYDSKASNPQTGRSGRN